MKHNSVLFFILLSLGCSISYASNCESLLGQCSYYKCIQHEMKCSESNYLSSFAIPYCYKYKKDQPNYSSRGQIFLTKARYCLQEQIEFMDDRTCKTIRPYAVNSHIGCYLNAGFCELNLAEKMRITWIASSELIHSDVRRAGLETMKLCNQSRFSTPGDLSY